MSQHEPPAVDVLVVGAGLAGLSCARGLTEQGRQVVVVDKGRGLGGRCATWRGPGELPLDYGVLFLHGEDAEFIAALQGATGITLVPGWPTRVEGGGTPCQVTAFAPREQRFGIVEGVSAWPKELAQGLDVRRDTKVVGLELDRSTVEVQLASGGPLRAQTVVLTLPCEQTLGLLESWAEAPAEVDGARHLLRLVGTVPCLTVMATYPSSVPAPSWDMLYPEDSAAVKLLSQESTKRPAAGTVALVVQARAAWSRERLEADERAWTTELLAETARIIGPWATQPEWSRSHRWRYGRSDLSTELAGPVLLDLGTGAELGIAGELFARGAGAEAAWISGQALARRMARTDR